MPINLPRIDGGVKQSLLLKPKKVRPLKVLLAHPGTQSSFHLAVELQRQSSLAAFHTGFAFCADGWANRAWHALPSGWQKRVDNRRIDGLPTHQLHCHLLGELWALLRLRRGGDPQAVIHQRNARFQRAIPDSAIASAQAVIGFDTSSWILAERCAYYGVPLILVQTTWHPDAKVTVYEQVKRRFPGWVAGIQERSKQVRAAEAREHADAKLIVVASSYTRQSLINNGVSAAKICVNPYGVDCSRFSMGDHDPSRKLRFVFIGAINAFKGVPILLEAWQQLATQQAELWLVGHAPFDTLRRLPRLPGLRYIGMLPRAELSSVLRQCDVLVFPSYYEGFGKVILEAMACGLPVLTTTATAGQDILSQGQDGWIIEPDSVEQLIETMSACLSNRKMIRKMGECARTTAERFTWAEYGRRWIEILGTLDAR
ncbi:MAG: glycosyltransferase family 4 protein [Blastocatellia bacterium]